MMFFQQQIITAVALLAFAAFFVLEGTCAYVTLPLQKAHILPFTQRPQVSKSVGKICSYDSSTILQIKYLPNDDGLALSYGERSRPFRRDVFDNDEWVRVRSTVRFSSNLLTIFESGVVRQLLREIFLTTSIASFICLYNALLVNGYDDFAGIHHDPLVQGLYVFSVPSVFFSLTSPALSLLLGK
jgi:hypothetical protein